MTKKQLRKADKRRKAFIKAQERFGHYYPTGS